MIEFTLEAVKREYDIVIICQDGCLLESKLSFRVRGPPERRNAFAISLVSVKDPARTREERGRAATEETVI